MGWFLLGVLCLLLLLIAVLLIRVALFKPKGEKNAPGKDTGIDHDRAVEHLAKMVRIPTVSSRKEEEVDEKAFEDFRNLLEELYPRVTAACPRERIGKSGILYHWKGKNPGDPSVLMAHYDVVPAGDLSAWKKSPFSGEVDAEGVLWGRGTLDTKGTLCGILEAAETLLEQGYVPERDVYFSFSGDEEIMGPSAPSIVEELHRRGIHPALVLDEGGAVVEGAFPGVKEKTAVVGVCEKGQMDVEFSIKSKGGHTSAPPVKTPLAALSKAVCRIEKHPFPAVLTPAARDMFDTLGRYSSFGMKIIFANLWLFLPLLKKICTVSGGELNALMRTTCCFTVAEGSQALNAIPTKAKMCANLRLIRGNSMKYCIDYLKKIVGDEDIEVRCLQGNDASPYSPSEGPAWEIVRSAIGETWPEAVTAPYMMMACSDSRHFCRISENVLRFSAMELSKEERGLIHGLNERVPSEKVGKAADFFWRILKQC